MFCFCFLEKLSDKEHREKSWNIYFNGRERPHSTIENYDSETGDRIKSLDQKSKSSPNVNHYLSYIKNKFAKAPDMGERVSQMPLVKFQTEDEVLKEASKHNRKEIVSFSGFEKSNRGSNNNLNTEHESDSSVFLNSTNNPAHVCISFKDCEISEQITTV